MQTYINKITKDNLDKLIENLPQSILMTGQNGVGFSGILRYIADKTDIKPTVILPEKDEKIDLEKGIISVGLIRQVIDSTKTIATKRTIIAIDMAEKMNPQAQNAFLKTLEEPNNNIHYILMTHSHNKLLSTITSRTTRINIRSIDQKQSEDLLDSLNVKDQTKKSQIMFIAGGSPAEMSRLALDDDLFAERSGIVRDARSLLTSDPYEKLKIISSYKDSAHKTNMVIDDAMNLLRISLAKNPRQKDAKRLKSIIKTKDLLNNNINPRLALADSLL